jgi:hypothetical protein
MKKKRRLTDRKGVSKKREPRLALMVTRDECRLLLFLAWNIQSREGLLTIPDFPVHFSEQSHKEFADFIDRVFDRACKFEDIEKEQDELGWMLDAFPDGYVSDGVRVRRGPTGRAELYSE